MKAREALLVFERAKETGFCVSLRGFSECVGVVPSTIVNWKNNPEKELRDIETIKVQYVKEGVLHQENLASGEWEIIDESDPVDWSSFRREAAKDFISGMLANVSPAANQWTTPEIVSAALEIADELIKQLKQE